MGILRELMRLGSCHNPASFDFLYIHVDLIEKIRDNNKREQHKLHIEITI